MPEVQHSFTIQQPISRVWRLFQDVPAVADCMPGVELLGELDGGSYEGRMTVKLGPIGAHFLGTATLEDIDEVAHSGVISAKGVDRKGGSRASAKIGYSLAEGGPGTRVEIQADLSLQGPMAQFGRTGLIQDVTVRLTEDFAQCLETKLSAGTLEEAAEVRAAELQGLPLFIRSLASWLKHLLRRRPQ